MELTHTSYYSWPVDQLLTYGEGKLASPRDWPNYLELGLGTEQIPDLIRMATDIQLSTADGESLEIWAPLHAWRALGQLHAEAAIDPLISLFEQMEDDEWVEQELPDVFGMIGPVALPALTAFLVDSSHKESALISVISCIKHIATSWPEARSMCVELLIKQLELFSENEPGVNGFLILALVNLQAKEAASLMERTFAADRVDHMVMGDWEEVQLEMGLKSAEEVAQIRSERLAEVVVPSTARGMTLYDVSSKRGAERGVVHKKAKSKMAKQSRKKNRKR